MGLLVNTGVLPDGIAVSNVYMCFRQEVIYVTPGARPKFVIDCKYRVYPDANKRSSYEIRVPVQVRTDDVSQGVYTYLYNHLKSVYPDSINM